MAGAVILWLDWQEEHITTRHGVSRDDFEHAWQGRVEDFDCWRREGDHPSCDSRGYTARQRLLAMIWRWQDKGRSVWPITAFFVKGHRSKETRHGKKQQRARPENRAAKERRRRRPRGR